MRYKVAETLADAVAALANAGGSGRVLAGGTDLIVQMNAGTISPEVIVDIKNIPELRRITPDSGGFRVGAAVTGAELNEHAAFRTAWPGVCEGMGLIGSSQVQSRATLGGNLCNASPAADSVPAMIAAGAVLDIIGPHGRRDLAVEDLPTAPGRTGLAPDEIVVSIRFAPRGGAAATAAADAYLRLTPRTEMDIAVVGVGVSLELDADGICTAARVGLGAVARTALLVEPAAAAIIATRVSEADIEALAAATAAAARPIDDKRGTREYRITISRVLARRAASIALARARAQQQEQAGTN